MDALVGIAVRSQRGRRLSTLRVATKPQRAIQSECEERFRRNTNAIAARHYLDSRSTCGTGRCADCCTGSAAGDGAEQGPEYRSAAYHLSGSPVLPESLLLRLFFRDIANHIVCSAVHRNRTQSQFKLRSSDGASLRGIQDDQLRR